MAQPRTVVLDVYRIDAVRRDVAGEKPIRVVVLERVKTGANACPWAELRLDFPGIDSRTTPRAQDIQTDISASSFLPLATLTRIPVGSRAEQVPPIFIDASDEEGLLCASKLKLSTGPVSSFSFPGLPDVHALPPMTLSSEDGGVESGVNPSQYILEFAGPSVRDLSVSQKIVGDPAAWLAPSRVRRIVLSAGGAVYLTSFFTVLRTEGAEPLQAYRVPLFDTDSYAALDAEVLFERNEDTPVLVRKQNLPDAIAESLDSEAARALGLYNAMVQFVRRMYALLSPAGVELAQRLRDSAIDTDIGRKFSPSGNAYVIMMAFVNGAEPFSSAKAVLRTADPSARVDDPLGWYYLAAMILPETDAAVQRYAVDRTISTTVITVGLSASEETRYQRAFFAWLVVRYALMALSPVQAQEASKEAYEKLCTMFVKITDFLFSSRAWLDVLQLTTGILDSEWTVQLPARTEQGAMQQAELLLTFCAAMYSVRKEWLAQGLRNGLALASVLLRSSSAKARLVVQTGLPLSERLVRADVFAALESRAEVPAAAFHGRLNREGDWPSLVAWASRAPIKCKLPGVSEIGEDPGDFIPVPQELAVVPVRRRRRDEETRIVPVPPRSMAIEPVEPTMAEIPAAALVVAPGVQEQIAEAEVRAAQRCADLIEEKNRRIVALEGELETVREAARAAGEATASDKQAASLCRIELDKKTSEAEALRADLAAAKKRADDAAEDQARAEQTYAALEAQYKEQIASIQQDLNGQIDRYKDQLVECSEKAKQFEADVVRCARNAGESVTGVMRGLRSQQQRCKDQLKEATSRATRLQIRIADLEKRGVGCSGQRGRLAALDEQVRVLREQLGKSAEELRAAMLQNAELQKENADLAKKSSAQMQEEAREDEEEDALVGQLERLTLERNVAKENLEAATSAALAARERNAELIQLLQVRSAELEALQAEYQDSIEVRGKYAQEFDKLTEERDNLEATVRRLQDELTTASGSSGEIVRAEYEAQIQRIREEYEQRLRDAESRISQQAGSYCGVQVGEATRQLEAKHREAYDLLRAEYQQAVSVLQSQVAASETREKELRAEAERAISAVQILAGEQQVTTDLLDASLEARLAALKDFVADDQFAQTSQIIGKCESEVAALKNQQDALRRALDAAQAMANRLDQQNAALAARNEELTKLALAKFGGTKDARPDASVSASFEGADDLRKIVVAALLNQLRMNPSSGGIGFGVRVNDLKQ